MRPLVILILLIFIYEASAQPNFDHTFYSDVGGIGYSIVTTSDGGYACAGRRTDSAYYQGAFHIIRLDPFGDLIWEKVIETSNHETAHSIKQTADNGFIICGSSSAGGIDSLMLVRLKFDGELLWNRKYSFTNLPSYGYDVVITADNNFIAAGRAGQADDTRQALLKTNGDGNGIWSQVIEGAAEEWTTKLHIDEQENLFTLSSIRAVDNTFDIALRKLNENGTLIWTQLLNAEVTSYGDAFSPTADGGFIITGRNATQGWWPYLLKTNASGQMEWTHTYDNHGYGRGVLTTPDGGYILAGRGYVPISGNGSGSQFYVYKTNSSGYVEWENGFPSANLGIALAVAQGITPALDGNYVLCGVQYTALDSASASQPALRVLKIDGSGLIMGLGDQDDESKLVLYPNPFTETIRIQYPESLISHSLQLVITDMCGRKVFAQRAPSPVQELALEGLSSGLYIAYLVEGSSILFQQKMIKR